MGGLVVREDLKIPVKEGYAMVTGSQIAMERLGGMVEYLVKPYGIFYP